MIYSYLQRGVAAGLVAGLAYGLYMILVGNPLTEYVHEAGHSHDHGHSHDAAHTVSETTTAVVSAGSGVLWAIFLGGCFAGALYLFEPALPGTDGVKPYLLAGAGFFSVSAVPWLALPPAAPGAENLYAVDVRLGMYLALIAVGVAVSATAIAAYNRAAATHPGLGILAAMAPVLVVAIAVPTLTPTIVTHPGLSADLVAAFQGLVVVSQAALWLCIAAAFNGVRRLGADRSTDSPGDAIAG